MTHGSWTTTDVTRHSLAHSSLPNSRTHAFTSSVTQPRIWCHTYIALSRRVRVLSLSVCCCALQLCPLEGVHSLFDLDCSRVSFFPPPAPAPPPPRPLCFVQSRLPVHPFLFGESLKPWGWPRKRRRSRRRRRRGRRSGSERRSYAVIYRHVDRVDFQANRGGSQGAWSFQHPGGNRSFRPGVCKVCNGQRLEERRRSLLHAHLTQRASSLGVPGAL